LQVRRWSETGALLHGAGHGGWRWKHVARPLYEDILKLNGPVGNNLAATYIVVKPEYAPLAAVRDSARGACRNPPGYLIDLAAHAESGSAGPVCEACVKVPAFTRHRIKVTGNSGMRHISTEDDACGLETLCGLERQCQHEQSLYSRSLQERFRGVLR
jgi:hypothetical protein